MLPIVAVALLFAALGASYFAYRQWTAGDDEPASDWQARLAAMGRRVGAGSRDGERKALQSRLQAAGVRDPEAVDLFLAIQLTMVLVVAAIALIVGGFLIQALDDALLLAVGAVAVGYLLPLKLLDARANARRLQISRALPGAVDLLVSTIDAGLSVDQALERVGAAIDDSDPPLAEELAVTAREINAGIPLDEAMRRLGRRVGLEELQGLCAVIAQASVLGARIGQSLRDYSDASRRQRIAGLEERAGKLSARLTMPIVFCLLPASLLVVIAPAVVDVVRAFGESR